MARVCRAARQRHVAVHHQPARSIEIFEDAPELCDLYRNVDRFLSGSRHSRSEQSYQYPYDHDAHRSSTTYLMSVMIQPPAAFSRRSGWRLEACWRRPPLMIVSRREMRTFAVRPSIRSSSTVMSTCCESI